MSLTRAQTTELANRLANLPVVCRVQTFNELIPWLRLVSPRYSVIDFYEKLFWATGDDWARVGGTVHWDNILAKAVIVE